MAKRLANPPRKQRTRAHVLADLSANHVERFALHCGFAVERLRQDYGLDLAVFTFDDRGYLEGGVLWMQLKATDHLTRTADSKAILVRLDRRDVLSWIAEANPVTLMIYNAANDRAYWLPIQRYFATPNSFAKLRGKTVTVRIPAANLLTEKAMRAFAQEKKALRTPEGVSS